MRRYKNLIAGLAAVLTITGVAAGTVAAQAVTHAYKTDRPLQRGLIVRIAEKDKTKVEPLTADSIADMEGIVVAANDAPVTISDQDPSAQQVFVATTGKYLVLVSNQNGAIKAGDHVTISSLAGIGMLAGTKESMVVGRALSGFDGKTQVSSTASLKGPDGKDINVAIGMVAVDINISRNPKEAKKETMIAPGLSLLQNAANTIARKHVDPGKVYLSALVLLLTMAVSGSIVYGGVRSSMVSIGRNPLAKGSIVRGLVQVVLVGIIILIIGLLGVYLLLKL